MAGLTVLKIREKKRKAEPIVCLTAYDALSAALAQEAGVDVILVGDSIGNTLYGYDTTLRVDLETMVRHTETVCRIADSSFVVADLPFGSYQESPEQAVRSAVALMKAGAQAVKLEGVFPEQTRAIVAAGIPLMGHIGFTPQFVHALGGHRVQGRNEEGDALLSQACELEALGVFSMVLELVPADLASRVTQTVSVPTIGIGAGVECDGQIQVFHDILGLSDASFKHSKRFVSGREVLSTGVSDYVKEVRAKTFPGSENSF